MTNRTIILGALLCVTLASHSAIIGRAETISERRATSVLFNRFETVVYTRTDFLSRTSGHNSNYVDSAIRLRLPFLELLGGLKVLGTDAASVVLDKYSAALVGAKDFAPPVGLGMVSSRKCYIAILNSGDQPNIEPTFHQAAYELIDGRQVWTWSAPPV